MIKIGITGQEGFIGTHLYNFLALNKEVKLIDFSKSFFENQKLLQNFVKQCDVIVHLAAKNRHNDPLVIYDTNVLLVKQLIGAMEKEKVNPHILFSSSTQEEKDNPYGNSKKEGRKLLSKWAEKNEATFTGLIIPNVFGPFGNPYYNSVIATFSYQLTHNEIPKINIDGNLKLIYINELVEKIWNIIDKKISNPEYNIPFTNEIKVSEILKLLESYKQTYFNKNIFPSFQNQFEQNLFNTFRSYIEHKNYFPVHLKKNTDNRGSFVETVKALTGGQFSFSTSHPGITRGNHFHTRKMERFAVISGKAKIELRKIGTKEVLKFDLDGENPSFVDMPVWFTHNITNIGKEDLVTLFWINEFFDPNDPDTYFENV
ncbi:MAG TPA: NAD-dependent epimerase/dehydratase family protein [Hanamia sp.]|nr:NAD-dependent epimerase/dehydratase family protein [Hanamia sp.]